MSAMERNKPCAAHAFAAQDPESSAATEKQARHTCVRAWMQARGSARAQCTHNMPLARTLTHASAHSRMRAHANSRMRPPAGTQRCIYALNTYVYQNSDVQRRTCDLTRSHVLKQVYDTNQSCAPNRIRVLSRSGMLKRFEA